MANGVRAAISMAITPEHAALAETAANLLAKYQSLGAARATLATQADGLPAFWTEIERLGWLGLHVPEQYGGAGFGLLELTIIAEQMGRALAPGPFLPTVIASAVLAEAGGEAAADLVPGLTDGSRTAGLAFEPDVVVREGVLHGRADVVLDAGAADVLLVPCGADVAVVDPRSEGVHVRRPAGLDPSRPCAVVAFDAVPATIIPGASASLRDIGRIVMSAEAARRCAPLHPPRCRLREVARAVRAADRDVPGGEAPLRQHAGGYRAGRRRGLGRRARGCWRGGRAKSGCRHCGGDGRAGGLPVRRPRHPGPRRYRIYVGARRAPLPASGHGAAWPARAGAGGGAGV